MLKHPLQHIQHRKPKYNYHHSIISSIHTNQTPTKVVLKPPLPYEHLYLQKRLNTKRLLLSSPNIYNASNISTTTTTHVNANHTRSRNINTTNGVYRLTETLYQVRTKLNAFVNDLACKSLQNTRNESNKQIITTLQQMKRSLYTQSLMKKTKVIRAFINNVHKDKFKCDIPQYRKVFVIKDGTVILNRKIIPGCFIDIPQRKYVVGISSKQCRLKLFKEMMLKCKEAFNEGVVEFKSVFLPNGIVVNDLGQIPDNENVLFVSKGNVFQGVHIHNTGSSAVKTYSNDNDNDLLKLNDTKNALVLPSTATQVRNTSSSSSNNNSNNNNVRKYKFKTKVKHATYLNDNSFTFGYTVDKLSDKDVYVYYSENELPSYHHHHHNTRTHHLKLTPHEKTQHMLSLLSTLSEYEHIDMLRTITAIKRTNTNRIQHALSKRPNENTYDGLNTLITNYNNTRFANFPLPHPHSPPSHHKPLPYILKNKLQTRTTFTPFAITAVNTKYPDLISQNIPSLIHKYKYLKRNLLYELYTQYKLFMIICCTITSNLNQVHKGLDFNSFYNCLPQVRGQGKILGEKLFNSLLGLGQCNLDWVKYLEGMLTMRNKEISEKIDVFFSIIDTNENGMLSYDEVYELSKVSLERTIFGRPQKEDDTVIAGVAEHFANLIFELVDIPRHKEISFELIKEKIIEGKEAAEYLNMFICADNFT
jgi:Ca2+-binding EF-hand superfamily protein